MRIDGGEVFIAKLSFHLLHATANPSGLNCENMNALQKTRTAKHLQIADAIAH